MLRTQGAVAGTGQERLGRPRRQGEWPFSREGSYHGSLDWLQLEPLCSGPLAFAHFTTLEYLILGVRGFPYVVAVQFPSLLEAVPNKMKRTPQM